MFLWMRIGLSKTDVEFSLHVGPLLGLSQAPHELIKSRRILRCKLEPSEEIERFSKAAAVIQAPRDGREIFETRGDVMGTLLEDRTPCRQREGPTRPRTSGLG